ncbi:MAG: LD-carboxypeptidase [Oligoflexia bacterium]|nr:LD-carboxypeptidase [Oligoflexia bacterium]
MNSSQLCKTKIYPPKLDPKSKNEIRIIAPSRSMSLLSEETSNHAKKTLEEMGFKITFSKNINENNEFNSSSVKSRIEDINEAFRDENVKAILTTIGGYNCNQLLRYIDYKAIESNPKIFCGYSDITVLQNAIYTKTGLVTYSGPHFSTFGCHLRMEKTIEWFKRCFIDSTAIEVIPSDVHSDDEWYLDQEKRNFIPNGGYWTINSENAVGTILGGNITCFNSLMGSEYRPQFVPKTILFLEDDVNTSPEEFDRNLQTLILQPDFSNVTGIVIGRFQNKSNIIEETLIKIVSSKSELQHLPIVANVDFGHTLSMITFPIGGMAKIEVTSKSANIIITEH